MRLDVKLGRYRSTLDHAAKADGKNLSTFSSSLWIFQVAPTGR